MRIRKNAKLWTSLTLSHASGGEELLQSHVCQLNQSPWDVIPFSPHAPLLHDQFQGEDSFNGNGSLGDSIGSVESVASMMGDAARETKVDHKVVVNNDNHEIKEGRRKTLTKKLEDDDGETKIESEFKFKKVREYCKNDESKDQQQSVIKNDDIKKPNKGNIITNGGGRRGRPKAAKRGGGGGAADGNPYEFYYYSGFGPLWGKRRGGGGAGDRKGNKNNETNVVISDAAIKNTAMSRNPSPIKHENNKEEIDYVDDVEDNDEEEEECRGGDGGKKRMRKPVKARSLKSLM